MKILMVCGSSSPKASTSRYLLSKIKKKLNNGNMTEIYETAAGTPENNAGQIAEALSDCDALVIAYSLYVDAIPARLLETLKIIEDLSRNKNRTLRVYQIVNSGFYEAVQNKITIDMVWKWCQKCGFRKGCAVGIGAGPMVRVAPLGKGPSTNLGKTVDQLVEIILKEQTAETFYVEPNFPRFLYRLQFNLNWRKVAKKNGLKVSDLWRRQTE